MSEPFQVQCPKCKAKLKIKSRAAVGKKVPCPKCQSAFVIKAPAEEEDELAFLSMEEPEESFEEEGFEEEEIEESPRAARAGSRIARGRKTPAKKGKAKPVEWQKPLLIGVVSLCLLGGIGGLGYVGWSFLDGPKDSGPEPENRLDTVFLNPDTEVFGQVRVGEVWQSPLVQSIIGLPNVKSEIDKTLGEVQRSFGVSISDIDTVTVGYWGPLETPGRGGAGGQPGMMPMGGPPGGGMQMAGPPGGGMPGGMPMGGPPGGGMPGGGMPGAGSVAGSDKISFVVRSKIAFSESGLSGDSRFERTKLKGRYYYRSLDAQKTPSMYLADPNRLVLTNDSEMRRLLETGKNLQRREDLDFIDNSRHFLFAYLPKDPSRLDQLLNSSTANAVAAGGAPAAAGANLFTGKVKALSTSLHFSQDVDLSFNLNCVDSSAAEQFSAQSLIGLQQAKQQFAESKAQLQPMAVLFSLGEFVPILEQIVNSLQATRNNQILTTSLRIPGSIKPAIENFMNSEFVKSLSQGKGGGFPGAGGFNPMDLLKGMGGGMPGGFGGPFGGTPPVENPGNDDDSFGQPPGGVPANAPGANTPGNGFPSGPPPGNPNGGNQ